MITSCVQKMHVPVSAFESFVPFLSKGLCTWFAQLILPQDHFKDQPVPNGPLIETGDIPFKHNEPRKEDFGEISWTPSVSSLLFSPVKVKTRRFCTRPRMAGWVTWVVGWRRAIPAVEDPRKTKRKRSTTKNFFSLLVFVCFCMFCGCLGWLFLWTGREDSYDSLI